MQKIFLITLGFSVFLLADFTRDPNGTVSDSSYRLQWQDDYSDNSNTIKESGWEAAILYCENLVLDGKTDWRLPNINELKTIIDDTKLTGLIFSTFLNTNRSDYWSATTYNAIKNNAWTVDFNTGRSTYGNAKNSTQSVRCVRKTLI